MALSKSKQVDEIVDEGHLAIEGASLEYIPVDAFRSDKTYQRPPDEARVNKLAKNWKPGGLGVVIASKRTDDPNYYTLDGQHRIGALRRLGDKTVKVPTLVLEGLTVADEAEFFVLMNKNRRALLPSELFKASLAEGNPAAIEIKEVFDKLGLTLSSYGAEANNVRAVAAVWRIYNAMGAAGINATLSLIIQCWGKDSSRNVFNQAIMTAIARVLHYNEGNIKIDRLRNIISGEEPDVWLNKASQLRQLQGGDRIRTLANTFVSDYNRGLRNADHLDVNKMNQKKDDFKKGQKFERKTTKKAS